MKTFFICALILPFLSACATADQSSASDAPQQEAVYTTGSNMPSKKASSRVDTLSGEQAQGLFGKGATQGKNN
ncbi:hypothetical protein SAMN04515618_1113 [Collimonas sp. OK307]|uniref:hypothetical protein n=1 Tax=Collimonas sp. OK307 TaxID=1801620 RepID=UPI0008E4553C|nr:hypothetical protein [Collimonas sp. OK307]SFI12800.1 hypothetical protein SAMN04515618_1113 [Collimonas sp. OK307]